MKRIGVLMLSLALVLSAGLAYADVHITLLNTKGEIQAQLEDAAKAFSAENPGITLDIQPTPTGSSPFQILSSVYASGNAPTLYMGDTNDMIQFADKFSDLKNEKWIKDSSDNFEQVTTASGSIVGFPFTVEGYGMIYNKAVLAKAGVDPSKIHTTKDLEAAFKKVQATGAGALVIAPMDWSLGAHFLGIAYSLTAKDQAGLNKLVADFKAGKVDVSKNKAFSGLLDTFDVMKKYNVRKADALAVTYDECPALIGPDKVGFYFQGNWTWPQISGFATDQKGFGFIPVPISNNPADFGNSGIPVGVTKYIALDKKQNSAAQQAAGKKFLEWLVYSKTGQDAVVNKCNIIPAFNNVALEPKDPLAISIRQYVAKKQTLFWINMPAPDHWSKVGASMQKYLVDKIDRAGLYAEIQDYWKNVK
jgi:raffinose/stachyose/melibiose transport system substrate-binding protein